MLGLVVPIPMAPGLPESGRSSPGLRAPGLNRPESATASASLRSAKRGKRKKKEKGVGKRGQPCKKGSQKEVAKRGQPAKMQNGVSLQKCKKVQKGVSLNCAISPGLILALFSEQRQLPRIRCRSARLAGPSARPVATESLR